MPSHHLHPPCYKFSQISMGTSNSNQPLILKIMKKYSLHKAQIIPTPFGFSYGESPLNILDQLAILLIDFFSSQMNLFLSFFFFMCITFPFKLLSRLREISVYSIPSFIYKRIETQKSIMKMGMRFCWAFLSAICVWFILVGMLLSGFVIGGFTMKHVVKLQPIEVTETLNFDYTMVTPVAVVPLPPSIALNNHQLQVTLSLTMPESEYNRNLGVFQVKMELLSATGKITSSASYPCMLHFKSQPVRIAETLFKSVPLMAGFQAEVQTLKINFDEFQEPKKSTGSMRVVLEQRAEYKNGGGGIPEVYSASIQVRSKLSGMKQMLWAWRISVFVWISIMSFLTQLVVVLTFYRTTLTKAKKEK